MSGIHGFKPEANLRTAKKAAAVIVNGDVLFTVSGGAILARSITGYCKSANDATASTVQLSADPTEGGASTISGASASLANAAAGTSILVTLATAATAPAVVAAGVGVMSHTTGAFIPPGVITAVVGVGSTTGTWEWVLQYEPLDPNVVVS
jgi:hypothetical protein